MEGGNKGDYLPRRVGAEEPRPSSLSHGAHGAIKLPFDELVHKTIIPSAAGNAVRQTLLPTLTLPADRGVCDTATTLGDLTTLLPDAATTYTFTGGQYHYNWSTRSITQVGEHRIYANLADGTKRYVEICLTK